MNATLSHKQGDLFENLPEDKHIIIPHICNNEGRWGSGFVVPLAKKWPVTREAYISWHKELYPHGAAFPSWHVCNDADNFALGKVQFVKVAPKIIVANMIAQDGVIGSSNLKPIKYHKLAKCMDEIACYCWRNNLGNDEPIYEIIAPKFGSGLAGGNWDFIEEFINEIWVNNGTSVTIYSL